MKEEINISIEQGMNVYECPSNMPIPVFGAYILYKQEDLIVSGYVRSICYFIEKQKIIIRIVIS